MNILWSCIHTSEVLPWDVEEEASAVSYNGLIL
jgi:hypothetical protein